ncbi:hypothetical protein FHP29_07700 [Nocardioides albidus]|uniref:Integral membrane bound transporter domain-containing protein n=1 Tax=Nocardioides albidus TaxID=1517589 RepID=A0A5C4W3U3_9ACTN|nr:FUSC family protein [Nocardioides albidus]TNM42871.1 hypothetical protein FHP29_07700 [Nocardioides albidus]
MGVRKALITAALLTLVLAVVCLPAIAVSFTPLAPAAAHVLAGIGVGVVATLYGGRVGVAATVASALLVLLAAQVGHSPWAAAALMTGLGAGIGACSLAGWHPAAVQAGAWPATVLIAPPLRVEGVDWTSAGAGQVLLPAVLVLLGGLWAAGLVTALGTRIPSFDAVPLDRLSAALYGAVLAVLLGLTALVTVAWLPGSTAGWALLTVLVLVRPGLAETRRRILARSGGTIGGGLFAAVVAFLVPIPTVLTAAGAVAMIVALGLYAKGASYALYAFALTAAIVLLSSPRGDVYAIDLQRVGFTLAMAVLITVLAAGYEPVLRAVLRRRSTGPRS